MKKILCITLILITAISVISCSCNETIDYKLYCSEGEDCNSQVILDSQGQAFLHMDMNVRDYMYLSSGRGLSVMSDVEKNSKITVDNNEYNLNYYGTTVLDYKYGGGSLNLYSTEKNERVSFRENGQLSQFQRGTTVRMDLRGSYTPEEAEDKARKIAKELFGENCLDEYVVGSSVYEDTCSGNNYIFVVFQRVIYGAVVDTDLIKFTFNLEGELSSIGATSFGSFKLVEEKVTKERYEKAEETLLAALSDRKFIQEDRWLYMNYQTGEVFLHIFSDGNSYYINVL